MKKLAPLLLLSCLTAWHVNSAILPAEKMLPDDTLVMFSITDFTKALDIYHSSPQGQLVSDPAMKPFVDKFVNQVKSQFLTPLEHDLGVHFDDFTSLPRGQVTAAVVRDGWGEKEKGDQGPGLLLLLDTKDKSTQLKTNLADIRKKWVDAGKTIKTEKIRDVEFSVVTLSTNEIPKSLQKAPATPPDASAPAEKPDTKKEPIGQVYVGQAESLLIMGNSSRVIEKVLAAMSGGSVKTLSDVASYNANQNSMFRDSPLFGWINARTLVDILSHSAAGAAGGETTSKVLTAIGVNGLHSIAFSTAYSNDGAQYNLMLDVPEDGRTGVFAVLAGEAKEYGPPPFVPADAVKFQRWRIDGQKTWATLRKIVGDFSAMTLGSVDFMLNSAEAATKEKDPSFDLKKNLFGNLGDDIISYEKSPKGDTLEELDSPPSLYLVGSPQPEQLAGALKTVFVLFSAQAKPTEREFQGRKIYSLPMPDYSFAPKASNAPVRSLNYAWSAGYLALTTDAGMLEEFLRSSQDEGKTLRDTAGLSDATQRVAGSGTSLFGYSNESESMRALLAALKKDSSVGDDLGDLGQLLMAMGIATGDTKVRDWIDLSLLPPYDKISKYFYFSVYSGSASPEGLSFKEFIPTPPQLKK